MIRSRKTAGGFTILEVMVALLIVSLGLMSVVASMNQMIDASNTMRERTYANWIAQNKIAEMRLANVLPDVGSSSGELEFANIDWAWRAVISETGVENLFRVDVTISIAGSDYEIYTVSGFIGEPVPPGQANRAWNTGPQGPGSAT
jgi:general secretion pathway protein I